MDPATKAKVDTLHAMFPSHTEKHCGDILTAAAGSVESAANLLMDSAMAPSMSDADDSDVELISISSDDEDGVASSSVLTTPATSSVDKRASEDITPDGAAPAMKKVKTAAAAALRKNLGPALLPKKEGALGKNTATTTPRKASAFGKGKMTGLSVKSEFASAADEDDVFEISGTQATAAAPAEQDDDDEQPDEDGIVATGAVGESLNSMPHPHSMCTKVHSMQISLGKRTCAMCFCYVCDVKVAKCKEWATHCNAKHTEPHWTQKRKAHKERQSAEANKTKASATSAKASASAAAEQASLEHQIKMLPPMPTGKSAHWHGAPGKGAEVIMTLNLTGKFSVPPKLASMTEEGWVKHGYGDTLMDPQPPEDEQEDVKDTEAAKRYLSPAYIRVFGGNPEGKGYICPRYQRERKLVTTKNRELDKVFDACKTPADLRNALGKKPPARLNCAKPPAPTFRTATVTKFLTGGLLCEDLSKGHRMDTSYHPLVLFTENGDQIRWGTTVRYKGQPGFIDRDDIDKKLAKDVESLTKAELISAVLWKLVGGPIMDGNHENICDVRFTFTPKGTDEADVKAEIVLLNRQIAVAGSDADAPQESQWATSDRTGALGRWLRCVLALRGDAEAKRVLKFMKDSTENFNKTESFGIAHIGRRRIHYGNVNIGDVVASAVSETNRPAADIPDDSLNVELYAFQKQSVQFMLDIENKGHEESVFTSFKLGGRSFGVSICDGILEDTPKPVRSGFLCEEMGLGKTVITLAMVVMNKVLRPMPVALKPRIQSGATLVVVPVTLVGQWIQEAKRHITADVSLYAYHGHSRKRDPAFLAKHDVVVTTYEILASDRGYHRQKAAKHGHGDKYVAPCDAIFWHRIVLDECHMLKSSNTARYTAVSALHSSYKWCVSGTPINTDIKDLRTQLQFLGIDFGCGLTNLAAHQKEIRIALPKLMIRHTHDQKLDGKTLLNLPKKVEKVEKIKFSAKEQAHYDALEKAAQDNFANVHEALVSTQTLAITAFMLPLRQACSGVEKKAAPGEDDGAALGGSGPSTDYECPICLDHCQDPVSTKCSHIYCRDCISGILTNGLETEPCPMCRKDVSLKDLKAVAVMPTAVRGAGASGASARTASASSAASSSAASASSAASSLAGSASDKATPDSMLERAASFGTRLKKKAKKALSTVFDGSDSEYDANDDGASDDDAGASDPNFTGRAVAFGEQVGERSTRSAGKRPRKRTAAAAISDDDDDDVDDDDDGAEGKAAKTTAKAAKDKAAVLARIPSIYTSKIDFLVDSLGGLRDGSSTAKTLVFSQYAETLKMIGERLVESGFKFRTLRGDMSRAQRTKALDSFQNDPPTTIFLLSTRAGAVGINLTQANHVYIMEPSINSALESQAIGRVYRMGQTREVSITRLVMDNSIETRLLTAREADAKKSVAVGSIKTDKIAKNAMSTTRFKFLFGLATAPEDAPITAAQLAATAALDAAAAAVAAHDRYQEKLRLKSAKKAAKKAARRYAKYGYF